MKDIDVHRPELDRLRGVAKSLKNEKFIGADEKEKIKNELESLNDRFDALDYSANIRQAE